MFVSSTENKVSQGILFGRVDSGRRPAVWLSLSTTYSLSSHSSQKLKQPGSFSGTMRSFALGKLRARLSSRVGACGRRPLESADPGVRRAGAFGTESNAGLGLGKLYGGRGLGAKVDGHLKTTSKPQPPAPVEPLSRPHPLPFPVQDPTRRRPRVGGFRGPAATCADPGKKIATQRPLQE